ncbi:hypothetical protein PoB_005739100 [Plakobranchus ocellatus]|uniref:Uncharacterized protein n=1 Tax=Plakobranchus ocellatus TaxID=259542 RepID=A0AAV4CHH0_9GAST|nr:hypothetical protein PoB_005739100 [Plakobranchus ocellatus]
MVTQMLLGQAATASDQCDCRLTEPDTHPRYRESVANLMWDAVQVIEKKGDWFWADDCKLVSQAKGPWGRLKPVCVDWNPRLYEIQSAQRCFNASGNNL